MPTGKNFLPADYANDGTRAGLASSLRAEVEQSLARYGMTKEQEARDLLSTQHLSAATFMKPFHLWRSRAAIGDTSAAVDARRVINDGFEGQQVQVYWTETGVRAIRIGHTDFNLKFDDRYALQQCHLDGAR